MKWKRVESDGGGQEFVGEGWRIRHQEVAVKGPGGHRWLPRWVVIRPGEESSWRIYRTKGEAQEAVELQSYFNKSEGGA